MANFLTKFLTDWTRKDKLSNENIYFLQSLIPSNLLFLLIIHVDKLFFANAEYYAISLAGHTRTLVDIQFIISRETSLSEEKPFHYQTLQNYALLLNIECSCIILYFSKVFAGSWSRIERSCMYTWYNVTLLQRCPSLQGRARDIRMNSELPLVQRRLSI